MSIASVTIRQEADKVLLVINGRALTIPYEQAEIIGRALRQKAKAAEEYAKANKIIADHALLTRVGAPIGLSNNPRIQDAVRVEAAHNRELRRALPGGVKSTTVLGVPSVRHGRVIPQSIGVSGIPSGETMGRIGGR